MCKQTEPNDLISKSYKGDYPLRILYHNRGKHGSDMHSDPVIVHKSSEIERGRGVSVIGIRVGTPDGD